MQRYISNELTHFVGRGLPEQKQFHIFCKILKSGWLTHPPHNPNISGNLSVRRDTRLSTNEMYSPQVVCFCDIPVADFHLHIRKYSPFGIAFPKDFLIQQGAGPVFYIPMNATIKIIKSDSVPMNNINTDEDWKSYIKSLYKTITKAELFDEKSGKLRDVLKAHRIHDPPKNIEDLQKFFTELKKQMDEMREVTEVDRWLAFHIFSYIKFFDAKLPYDHDENYYFEREWRIIGNVHFSLNDVSRVCLPSAYSRKFREEVSDYYGQITFAGECS